MSLLTLAPEVTRLRRVAKACAAGEISRREYREARHVLIDKFGQVESGGVEDTVPRFDLDITQRRGEMSVEPAQVVARPNWFMWMLILAVVVAALGAPLWSHAANVIPPVNDRDPDPRTSPTYNIQQVVWQAPEDLAALNHDVQTLLENGLAALKKTNAPAEHGFNQSELADVGRFLNAIGVHDEGTKLSLSDLQDLAALVATQKGKRGVSLVQLEQLAKQLEQFLRELGFPLARAYVPRQTIAEQTVQLGVQLGVLSGITVAQGQRSELQYVVADLLGKRVTRDAVETRLNRLNQVEGIQSEVSFVPGEEVGETEMVLRVNQSKQYAAGVGLDNYTLEGLGDVRVSGYGKWISPRGIGDVFTARAHTTLDPSDHDFVGIGYSTPMAGGRYSLSSQLAYADIELDGSSSTQADGVLWDAQLTDTRKFTRSHRTEIVYNLGVHAFEWDFDPSGENYDQQAWFVGAALLGHRLFDEKRVALSGNVQVLAGGVDDALPGEDDEFWRLQTTLNAWAPWQLPFLDRPAKVSIDVQAQLTDATLPPTLRFGGAGAYSNRGFRQGVLPLDRGIGVSGALRFDAPVGQWWMFVDATYGEQLRDSTRWSQLTSAGIGWEATLWSAAQGGLHSKFTLGVPLAHEGTGGFVEDGTQIFWSLRYAY